MVQQLVLSQVVRKQVNNFHESAKTESKTDSATIKLTQTQKAALRNVAEARGVGVSTLLAQAIEFHFSYIEHAEKLQMHRELVVSLLKNFK